MCGRLGWPGNDGSLTMRGALSTLGGTTCAKPLVPAEMGFLP